MAIVPVSEPDDLLPSKIIEQRAKDIYELAGAVNQSPLSGKERLVMNSLDDVHDILCEVWMRSMSADEAVEKFSALGWMRYDETGGLVACAEGDDGALHVFCLSA